MAWQAVYRSSDGVLVSVGDVVADPLPAGLATLNMAGPPADTVMWDAATRAFIPRPAKTTVDRVQEIRDDPTLGAVWSRLTASQQTALRNRLVSLLGPYRYRASSGSVNLG